MMNMSAKTIEGYIKQYPKEVQVLLKKMRAAIKEVVPKETGEKIGYGIPTFTFHGNLVHFGGYPKHIGFYPGPIGVAAFKKDLAKYKTSKGTIQFQLDEPIPFGLVKRITKYCVKVRMAKLKTKKK